MINIYICDDEKQELNCWKKAIEEFLIIEHLNQQLVCVAQTPDILLGALDAHPQTAGLYFLDICLHSELNGLQLAAEIRKRDPLGEIVFITSKSEMCYLTFTYHVRALDFIIKDIPENIPAKIHQCMNLAAEKEKQISALSIEPLYLKINGEKVFFNPQDILYIETAKDTIHKITLHTQTSFESIYGSLKEMESLLQKYDCFFRCNKSIIVNRTHIKKCDYKKKELFLSNGTVLTVSSRNLRNVETK